MAMVLRVACQGLGLGASSLTWSDHDTLQMISITRSDLQIHNVYQYEHYGIFKGLRGDFIDPGWQGSSVHDYINGDGSCIGS